MLSVRQMEEQRVAEERAKIDRLRRGREASAAVALTNPPRPVKRRIYVDNTDFWSLIDSRGGEDACHPWTGKIADRKAPPEHHVPSFCREGTTTGPISARRVLFEKINKRQLPDAFVISCICDNAICMNVKHLAIAPHTGGGRGRSWKHPAAVPFEEFKCD